MRRILLNTLLFMGLAHVMPGVKVTGFGGALISAFVFALLSVTVKPVLEFFAWPLNFLSLGLVNWLIAGFILLLASWLPGGLYLERYVGGCRPFPRPKLSWPGQPLSRLRLIKRPQTGWLRSFA